jgi:hypothetical protein
MVAKNYAEMRRGLAKKIRLGRKPGTKVAPKKGTAQAKAARGPAKTSKAPASKEVAQL